MSTRRAAHVSRIRGEPVPPCFPVTGPVHVFVVGEAPGPRGADKSGVPFWGDRAGGPLYRALAAAGACTMPPMVPQLPWDGQTFVAHGLVPAMHGVALGNAYDRCPSDDGQRFRAPSRAELFSAANRERLAGDLDRAAARGLRVVLALGRVAGLLVGEVMAASPDRWPGVTWQAVPHPSAQGLLSAAPDRGRGARLADLAAAWEADVAARVRVAREGAP